MRDARKPSTIATAKRTPTVMIDFVIAQRRRNLGGFEVGRVIRVASSAFLHFFSSSIEALLVLAGDYMLSPASAQSTSCGTPKNPCFVAIGYLNSNDEYVVCYSTAPCAKK